MPKEVLNEREFELVNIIGGQLAVNQRDLSRQMKLSLGMTNMLLHRLINKGYIRINQLNKKKIQYLVTPKGFAEKVHKSFRYTVKTITSIGLIKKRFKDILTEHYYRGERTFCVLGVSDFAFLVEVVLKEISLEGHQLTYINSLEETIPGAVLCICKEGVDVHAKDQKYIDFIKELAEDKEFTAHNIRG